MAKTIRVKIGPHKPGYLYDVKETPELYKIWGIYAGDGCITGQDPLEWLDIHAHSHFNNDDMWKGWICIANTAKVVTQNEKPTHLVLHELAHIICESSGHGKKWYDTVCRLGAMQEAKKYYKPRKAYAKIKIPDKQTTE